jgi:hypothetical protein
MPFPFGFGLTLMEGSELEAPVGVGVPVRDVGRATRLVFQ